MYSCDDRSDAGLEVVFDAARTSERRDVDGCCSRLDEGLRCSAGGSTGGKNVIHKQDALTADDGWIGNLEGATDVVATLARREARLAAGGTKAHERAGSKSEMPCGMRFAQRVNGAFCKNACLVESAVPVLAAMKRHGNDKQSAGSFRRELCDGGGKHGAQSASRRLDATVFQGMDRGAHPAFIGTESDSTDKGRRCEAAGTALIRARQPLDRW